ncbi:hypothetical protein M8J76_003794 [Diaphorina citri]|nr:hypothetical protein M8J76_003794 [Diaphorina citri]
MVNGVCCCTKCSSSRREKHQIGDNGFQVLCLNLKLFHEFLDSTVDVVRHSGFSKFEDKIKQQGAKKNILKNKLKDLLKPNAKGRKSYKF